MYEENFLYESTIFYQQICLKLVFYDVEVASWSILPIVNLTNKITFLKAKKIFIPIYAHKYTHIHITFFFPYELILNLFLRHKNSCVLREN